jgi:hypothetical protein
MRGVPKDACILLLALRGRLLLGIGPRVVSVANVALVVAAGALLACGPGRAALTPTGAEVEARPYPPAGHCAALGDVSGSAGDSWRPFSDDQLVEYATNDLRNEAAERGATYVQYGSPDFRRRLDHSSVTIRGEAFRCIP